MIAIGIPGNDSGIPFAETLTLLVNRPEVSRLLFVRDEPGSKAYETCKFLFLASAYFTGITNRRLSSALLMHQVIDAGEIMAPREARSK